jgi:dihydroflavonol-4-reductase
VKTLVTGATGFIGSHLVEALVHEGRHVRVLARPSSQTSFLEALGVEVVRGDLLDPASVAEAIRGCQLVYHLAARSSSAGGGKEHIYATNVQGAACVAQAALNAGVERLVYGSSGGIYGAVQYAPITESTKPNPDSYYRASKLRGEETLLALHARHGLPVVIARIASVYGPGSSNWLGLFQVIAAGRFRLIGAGKNQIHLAYISDIVRGLQRCGDVAGIEGEAYLLPGKEPIELRRLAALIAQVVGRKGEQPQAPLWPLRLLYGFARMLYHGLGVEAPYAHRYELFVKNTVFDGAKAQRELDYTPMVSLQDGIPRALAWYREHGHL